MRTAMAVAAAAVCFLAPTRAAAHFVLQAPPSWAEQDGQGNPQKTAPCGQADPQIAALPTNTVTTFRPGQTITVTVDERTFHPGHYRVVLSASGQGGLPPDPATMLPGTCQGLAIEDPPVYPVLADGMLQHTDPFDGPRSFEVTLPGDVTCASCALQVLEFMQADVGGSGNCFYHHCATLSIGAEAAGPDAGAGPGPDAGGCGCAVGEGRASSSSSFVCLLALAVIARRRRLRALLVAAPLIAVGAGGCGGDRPPEAGFAVSPGDVEDAWLGRLGTGPAQTAAASELLPAFAS